MLFCKPISNLFANLLHECIILPRSSNVGSFSQPPNIVLYPLSIEARKYSFGYHIQLNLFLEKIDIFLSEKISFWK